jgi:hypothetical protein
MATVNLEAAEGALRAAGVAEDEITKAIQGLATMRTTAGIEVVVNPAEERKFGDVSIFKVQGNGYRKPAMGIFATQLPDLIAQLTDANNVLGTEADES